MLGVRAGTERADHERDLRPATSSCSTRTGSSSSAAPPLDARLEALRQAVQAAVRARRRAGRRRPRAAAAVGDDDVAVLVLHVEP
jgi:D-aminopeptidase